MTSSVVRPGILLLDFKPEHGKDISLILTLRLLMLTLASYYGTEIGSEEVLAQIISSADHWLPNLKQVGATFNLLLLLDPDKDLIIWLELKWWDVLKIA